MQLPDLINPRVVPTLAARGVLRPMRLGRLIRIQKTINAWGRTMAAGVTVDAIRWPHETAFIDDQGELSFSELHTQTNSIANSLAGYGLGEGDRIAVLVKNNRYFVMAAAAASKLGGDYVLANTSFAGPQLKESLIAQEAKAIVYDPDFEPIIMAAQVDGLKKFLTSGTTGTPTLEEFARTGNPENLAPPSQRGTTIVLTSGTTGTPKGAKRPRPDTISPLVHFLKAIPRQARATCHVAAPLFHLHGNAQFEVGLALGTTVLVTEKFDPENTIRLIDKHKVQELVVVPVMLKRILELPQQTLAKYNTDSLRLVICSGSALNSELAKEFIARFGPVLYNLYGATELSWATVASPDDLIAAPGTIGKPPQGTRLAVLDDDNRLLGVDQVGRFFVGHEMLFEGYTNNAQMRPEIDGMMSVGDMGHFDQQGYFYVDSREDDMIVSGGENVYPGEVEELLNNHRQIEEAAVIGVEDKNWGQVLRAFVVSRQKGSLTEDQVKSYVKENLATFKVPKRVEFIDELPRNAVGKVVKMELVNE